MIELFLSRLVKTKKQIATVWSVPLQSSHQRGSHKTFFLSHMSVFHETLFYNLFEVVPQKRGFKALHIVHCARWGPHVPKSHFQGLAGMCLRRDHFQPPNCPINE